MHRLLPAGLAAVVLSSAPVRAELQAGTAVVDVTPQEWPLAPRGSFFPKPVNSAHDPLMVRCVVLDDGRTPVALAVVDSCMVHRDLLDPAKRQASEATGIPPENMLIAATHTHSAPFANAVHGTPQERAYQRRLSEGIVAAVTQAAGNRRMAGVGLSSAGLPDEVFNRRWHLKPGTVPTNP
ncbi:MAG: hypothetical protein HKO57_11630, partial [Akkermansiaceae bacterium]|nr:hypothetical protein [Akkermansiaceae bacterium]